MTMKPGVFADGTYHQGGGEIFESLNPVTGECLWQGHCADKNDIDLACQSARRALADWNRIGIDQRTTIIKRFATILGEHSEDIARTIATETGKALWDCRQELSASVAKAGISVQACHQRSGSESVDSAGGKRELRHKPHGVLTVFGPFNFPAHLPNGHIIPALLAGNTIVFKPSEMAPESARRYLECWTKAGLPAGVLNVANGSRDTGEALLDHSTIDGVLFTGSARTGQLIHQRFAGQTGKLLALELGGNNPLVISDTTNSDAVLATIVQSGYLSAGQRCTCARRLIVIDNPDNRNLLSGLEPVLESLKVGDPLSTDQPFYGAVISNDAADAILEHQQELVDAGAQVLHRCSRIQTGKPLLKPGLIDVTNLDGIADEEVFGPLVKVIRVADLDAAIDEANRTRFGLAAGIITNDDATWERFLNESRAGIVNRNLPTTGASSALPFGGIGASGNLRPSAFYAADYCAYPVASMTLDHPKVPENLPPGLTL
ncbi:MAG: N-succinylglutamate 5-semialdehyde dehydrogenase [marine bacterium B5-7]|nr:MAG: N-succinylglutamate 5-semialdehyde dehydrogenase [marine bacterium B5-7]